MKGLLIDEEEFQISPAITRQVLCLKWTQKQEEESYPTTAKTKYF
jgi:hypothetical protein